MLHRVVVTGVGLVGPLGHSVDSFWQSLIAGKSGLVGYDCMMRRQEIERFMGSADTSKLPSRVVGTIKYKHEGHEDGFDLDAYMPLKDRRRIHGFIVLGLYAADQAIADAGLVDVSQDVADGIGVIVGSGVGGWERLLYESFVYCDGGRMSPFSIPASLVNMASGHIAIKHGYRGMNCAIVSACSTGAHAIGEAARSIRCGDAKIMIAGGSEDALGPFQIAGFCAGRALSTKYNDDPEGASRPWDDGRDGFVMSEGAAVMVLEEYEHAKNRGARMYGELMGYGVSCDAHHITAPPDDGRGGMLSMRRALSSANLNINDIDYINAHGTSTVVGDAAEMRAVSELFDLDNRDRKLYMSSVKSSIGHLLGAAGSIEAIACLLSLRDGILPPTLNLHNPMFSHVNLDLLPFQAREQKINTVLSNSFGFGGTNVSLVFGRV